MRLALRHIRDVAEQQLCCGCGACAYVDPANITMIDAPEGRRPRVNATTGAAAPEALAACPGQQLTHSFDRRDPDLIRELLPAWGPVLEVWEGYAGDAEIRYAGSSGGAASALALYCLEQGGFAGLLHVAARPDAPYLNHTVLSTRRDEILAATGSRYAPASPCDGLQRIEDAVQPCVFIGKPCDVAGATMAAQQRPRLAERLGLTIAIFCAGTPTNESVLALLRRVGVPDPAAVLSLRYRGLGWPGHYVVRFRTERGQVEERSLTYADSWGLLAGGRQWRCNVCPDHTGEFADIAVGDPWYRDIPPDEPGRSLILVRTRRGQVLLRAAVAAGYLRAERAAAHILPDSQPNLLRARALNWGRLLGLRLWGIPVPRFRRLPMAWLWLTQLGLSDKLRSVFGTSRRIRTYGLDWPRPVTPLTTALATTEKEREGPLAAAAVGTAGEVR